MTFTKLYNLIQETAFDSLPKGSPYGYWIFPNGDFATVKTYGHEDAADMIIANNPELLNDYNMWCDTKHWKDPTREVTFLLSKNYMQVVTSPDHSDLIWRKKSESYTNSQMRTVKDLARFYKQNLRVDNH